MSKDNIRIYYWTGCFNFGDELSEYLLYHLIGEHPVLVDVDEKNKLLAIGSIINNKSLYTDSHIWGSGLLADDIRLKLKVFPLTRYFPQLFNMIGCKTKIYALRGPLSRKKIEGQSFANYLNSKMFVDPENLAYGDPAVLLPLIYQKKSVDTSSKVGLIFHHVQSVPDAIKQYLEQNGIRIINIERQGYEAIESFIDEVCSCDKVFSVSLHGIIVAQAYGIPAQWLQIEDYPLQNHNEFKFNDYFLGVGLEPQQPLRVSLQDEPHKLVELLSSFDVPKATFDLALVQQRLLKAFPFPDKLKGEFRQIE